MTVDSLAALWAGLYSRLSGAFIAVSIVVTAVAVGTGTPASTASAAGASGDVPTTMRAAAIDRTGGPEVLTLHTLPVPQVGANEVLIAVRTAGVSVWDAEIRQRLTFVSHPHYPLVLGTDGAGLVVAVGVGVRKFRVGDAVYGHCWDNPKGGFYAEYAAVPATCVAHLPHGVTLDAAGALAASGLTALQGLDFVLQIRPGDRLIIHGASGAVGTLAIQLAKLRGAKVLATASGEDGIALVRRLGADAAVDGRHGDIAAAAQSFAPEGAGAVLALAGGPELERCIDALGSTGRVAFPNGIDPVPKPRAGIRIVAYDAISGPEEAELARLNQAVEARSFEIPISSEYPLADAAEAHQRMAAGHVLGKILLRVR